MIDKLIKINEQLEQLIRDPNVPQEVRISHRWLSRYIRDFENERAKSRPDEEVVRLKMKDNARKWNETFNKEQ
tara:strand:- start:1127 stop:1345 length:219 start_codon:yes stop_codon:yes gene_type:complete